MHITLECSASAVNVNPRMDESSEAIHRHHQTDLPVGQFLRSFCAPWRRA
jgi:hypothetical protein